MNRRDFLKAVSLMTVAALAPAFPEAVKAMPIEKADCAIGFFDKFGKCLAIGCAKFKPAKNGTIQAEPLSCYCTNTGVISELRIYTSQKEVFRGSVGLFDSGCAMELDYTYVNKNDLIYTNNLELKSL